ncbi:MAG: DUF4494 domain-containing protein [Bacteroidaceae bacterium]|nr:DUF4494 domain-containing protein [Bacteroidaceae bacterium]
MEWFECKVRYDKTMENGLSKQVTETYLVDALSFTEAERRFIEEIEPFMGGEFTVTDIRRTKIAELFESNDGLADRWFKCKVAFITLDEKTGAEKRANQMMMVQAIDLRDAVKALDKAMEGTLGDYVIVSVAESPVMDVYRYKLADDDQQG